MVKLFKALGDENRLRIINLLVSEELCVCEIEVILEMTQSNVSRHLSKLKNVGIIESYKEAQWVHYKISGDFEDKNKLLFNYMKLEFENHRLYSNDLNRFKKYKKCNLNCQWVNEDRDKVNNLLKEEE